MAGLQDLMNAIAQMEGFNTLGTIANRLNNPGNLRYSPTQTGTANTASGTFATFDTSSDGWAALQSYIQNQAASNPNMTLQQFVYMYAPPTENNSSSYLNYVTGQLGVSADTTIGSIVNGSVDSSSGDSGDSANSNILGAAGGLDLSSLVSGIDLTDPTTLVGVGIVGIALIALVAR